MINRAADTYVSRTLRDSLQPVLDRLPQILTAPTTFSISGKLRTPVDWFLWVPFYSGMFVFCDIGHMYYVFLSLVNLSAVNSFHISRTPQFPFTLAYCLYLYFSAPHSYLVLVLRTISIYVFCICSISSELRLLSPHALTCPLLCLLLSQLVSTFPGFRKFQSPEFLHSLALKNPGSLRDSTGNRAIP